MTVPTEKLLFKTYTLALQPDADDSHLISRPHLEQFVQYQPWAGNIVIIEGPAGSGKSVLIQRSLATSEQAVEYIGARTPPLPTLLSVVEPSAADHPARDVDLIADLLTLMSNLPTKQGIAHLRTLLARMGTSQRSSAEIVVLDDLDLVLPAWYREFHRCASEMHVELLKATLYLVTRRLPNEARGWLMEQGKMRVLPRERLQILPTELEDVITAKTFGNATRAEILTAFTEVGGWFAGMQHLLGTGSLEDYVHEEIVLCQSPMAQQMMYALGVFPCVSAKMIADILAPDNIGVECARDILLQLPLWQQPEEHLHVSLPPAIRYSLQYLARLHGDLETIRRLCQRGIAWYVETGDHAAARELALITHLEHEYLACIHSHCAMLAQQEQWSEILATLVDIPEHILTEYSDLTFWATQGYAYEGLCGKVNQLLMQALPQMLDSSDEITRGRGLIRLAWHKWAAFQEEDTYRLAVESFETLPEEALQERMFASVTAEIAAQHLGNKAEVDRWIGISTSCRTALAMGPEWWHLHAAYFRANYTALTGDLTRASRLAEVAIAQVDPTFPRPKSRLLTLMAYIEMEKGNYIQARKLLSQAAMHANGIVPKSMVDMANAQMALIMHDGKLARSLLEVEGPLIHNRVDRNAHRLRLLALAEIMDGQFDLASDIISYWAYGDTGWPHCYAEPHPQLLNALIAIHQERIAEAVALAEEVAAEADRRGHLAITLAACAILAECHHRNGDAKARDRVLTRMDEIDPQRMFVRSSTPLGRNVRQLKGTKPPAMIASSPHRRQILHTLSGREKELINAAATGMSTSEIASTFNISRSTVKNHLASIYKKLGVLSREEAIIVTAPLRKR